MRFLGIDFGKKYLGLATTDPLQITARPFKTLVNNQDTIKTIKKICTEEEITKIILGLPKSLDGTINQQGQEVLEFKKLLEKELVNIPVELEDERFTTKIAHDNLKEEEKSIRKSKKLANQLAAQLILESYLESHQK